MGSLPAFPGFAGNLLARASSSVLLSLICFTGTLFESQQIFKRKSEELLFVGEMALLGFLSGGGAEVLKNSVKLQEFVDSLCVETTVQVQGGAVSFVRGAGCMQCGDLMVSTSVLRAGVVPIYHSFICILKGSPSVQTLCVFLPNGAPREGAFCQHPWGTDGHLVPRQGRADPEEQLWEAGVVGARLLEPGKSLF